MDFQEKTTRWKTAHKKLKPFDYELIKEYFSGYKVKLAGNEVWLPKFYKNGEDLCYYKKGTLRVPYWLYNRIMGDDLFKDDVKSNMNDLEVDDIIINDNIEYRSYNEQEPFKHQLNSFKKLIKYKVSALFMEMGTGKTKLALDIAYSKIKSGYLDKVCILCPASLKKMWELELKKTDLSYKIFSIESMSTSYGLGKHYEQAKEYIDNRTQLILDESTYIKNYEAKRTKNCLLLSLYTDNKIILSGSPVTKQVTDLYSQILFLGYGLIGYDSYSQYEENHIVYGGNFGDMIIGNKNISFLVNRLNIFGVQIYKKDCLDLHNKQHSDVVVHMTSKQKQAYKEKKIEQLGLYEAGENTILGMFTNLQKIATGVPTKINDVEHNFNTEYSLDDLMNGEVDIKEFSLFKILNRVKMAKDIISANWQERYVVFSRFKYELERLHNELDNSFLYTGDVSKKDIESNLSNWNENGGILLCTLGKGSHGLNLQKANHMIFLAPSFDYATHIQAQDRIHRIGQDKECIYTNIFVNCGIERMIQECLAKKENLLEKIHAELNNYNERKKIKWLEKNI